VAAHLSSSAAAPAPTSARGSASNPTTSLGECLPGAHSLWASGGRGRRANCRRSFFSSRRVPLRRSWPQRPPPHPPRRALCVRVGISGVSCGGQSVDLGGDSCSMMEQRR
jgi:hypothetical protein